MAGKDESQDWKNENGKLSIFSLLSGVLVCELQLICKIYLRKSRMGLLQNTVQLFNANK